ncbi:MAG TPA: G8 domain-containing protein [Polyangiaceae bacterium]
MTRATAWMVIRGGLAMLLASVACNSATTSEPTRTSSQALVNGDASAPTWPPTPEVSYEAPHAVVSDATTQVATIPRPPRVRVEPPHDCPYAAPDLIAWDPSWVGSDGTVTVPDHVRVLVRGNADIPEDTLIRSLYVPPTSELVLADEPATFHVTDMMVYGALRLGSPSCRLESPIRFVFDTDENVADPAVRDAIYNRMGLGIMVGPQGSLDLFGHLYQPTWTRLAATAPAGATQIVLAEPVDWTPGQQIVIATSARVDYPLADQNDVRTIVAVDGNLVTLDRPLDWLHYAGWEYQVEVGLLSRTLAFDTSDRVRAAAPTFGGHIMVHSTHARVSGVELHAMGQQNYLARYPFHWHRVGDVAGASYFTDSSVWQSNWRCVVVHRTSHAIVARNVAFDDFGHCYYLEDGLEFDNELSFNLAVRTKIMGPIDQASLDAMTNAGQPGFTQVQTPDLVEPSDRAAAGFYVPNGNNRIVGNATSGGFVGFSFPNLPLPTGGDSEGVSPILYGVSHFDGNTAHSAGYLWDNGSCIYVGGTLVEVDGLLQYTSGRSTDWNLLRHTTEVFNNTKTFLCEAGIVHWGDNPRIVNFEAWDNGLLAVLFGSASIQSSLVVATTGNPDQVSRPIRSFQQGFQFYDTRTQTILRDVVFRGFHHDPLGDSWATHLKEWDSCALLSMTHSDQYTPQQMNSVAGLHFVDVDDPQRLCVSDTGTLSSRNFNVLDVDGSMSRLPGDPVHLGPRLVASAYTDAWKLSPFCARHDAWGALVCPLDDIEHLASVGVMPNANVTVTTYGLDSRVFGTTSYSGVDYIDAQITAPSGVGWHHAFPGGVPDQFDVQVLQVPNDSFVLLSFSLPPGVTCSIADPAWTATADVRSLLASQAPAFTTWSNTCFVRIPPANIGTFSASGLSVPNMTWRGFPTPTTYFTIDTGCSAANPACATVASTVPTLPICDAGACVEVLASGQSVPTHIAVDSTNVYWTNLTASGSVNACAVGGCGDTPTAIASAQRNPDGIAVDGSNVYWTTATDGSVWKCPIAGCGGSPVLLATGQQNPFNITVDANNVYWTNNGGTGSVAKCAVAGCGGSPTVLASSQSGAWGIAVDATNVYWTNATGGAVMACAIAGCGNSPTVLASGQGTPAGIAVDAARVYWANNYGGTVAMCPISGCNGSPTVLASGQGYPWELTIDATNVYWTNNLGGSVMKCAKAGCGGQPTVLASLQQVPVGIAVDSTSVYWADQVGNAIMKRTPK